MIVVVVVVVVVVSLSSLYSLNPHLTFLASTLLCHAVLPTTV